MARGYSQAGSEINQYRVSKLGEKPPIEDGYSATNPQPIIKASGGLFQTASKDWDLNKPPVNDPRQSGKIYVSGYTLRRMMNNNAAPQMPLRDKLKAGFGRYDNANGVIGDGKFMSKEETIAVYKLFDSAKSNGDAIAVPLKFFIEYNKAAHKEVQDPSGPFRGDAPEGKWWPASPYGTVKAPARSADMNNPPAKRSPSSIKAEELRAQKRELATAKDWPPEPELGYPEGGPDAYNARQIRNYSVFRQGRWMIAD